MVPGASSWIHSFLHLSSIAAVVKCGPRTSRLGLVASIPRGPDCGAGAASPHLRETHGAQVPGCVRNQCPL